MQRLKQAKATTNDLCMHLYVTTYYYFSCLCYFARWKSWRMGIIFITYIFRICLAFCRKWRHLFELAAAYKVNLLFFWPSRSSSDVGAGLAVHQGIYQVIYIPSSSTISGCTLIGVRCTSWAPALTCKQLTPVLTRHTMVRNFSKMEIWLWYCNK